MQTRRKALKQSALVASLLASVAWWPLSARAWTKAAFDAKTVPEAVKGMGGGTPTASRDLSIQGPDISENSASVPLTVASTLSGVKKLLLLVEKNPHALAAAFHVSDALEPSFAIRVKMAQSSDVYAVAIMADGRALYAKKEIRVTLGGCGA